MFLHKILQPTFVSGIGLVLFRVANDLRASLDHTVDHFRVFRHKEKDSLAVDSQMYYLSWLFLLTTRTLSGTKYAEENPTPNCPIMGDVAARNHGLHESLGTRFGCRPKILHELVLCHHNARVLNHDGRVVQDDLDEEIWMGHGLFWIGDTLVTDLVEGIGRIRNQLAEKDVPAGVEGVDAQAHQLAACRH